MGYDKYREFGLSTSLAASTLFGEVDLKMQFANSIEADATSVSIVVHARRAMQSSLTQWELGVEPPRDLAAFFRQYGDCFVSKRTVGAEYLAVYTFYAENKTEKTDVQANLRAHGLWGGSVDAGLQAKLDIVQETSLVQTKVQQFLLGISGVPFPDSGEIVAFALKFPTLPMDRPAVLSFSMTGYEHAGINGMETIILNRDRFTGTEATPGYSERIVQLGTVKHQCAAIRGTYQEFGYTGDTEFERKCAMNLQDLETAHRWLDTMEMDPTQDRPAPPLPSLANGFPSLTVVRHEGPKWGDGGDSSFNDIPFGNELGFAVREIFLRGDDWVDQLRVMYINPNDRSEICTHGGEGGRPSPLFKLQAGELITSIFGATFNRYVSLLTFTTSFGQTFSWPTASYKDKYFDWTVPDGQWLVGFQGTAGDSLSQIQAITINLAPATWAPLPSEDNE